MRDFVLWAVFIAGMIAAACIEHVPHKGIWLVLVVGAASGVVIIVASGILRRNDA